MVTQYHTFCDLSVRIRVSAGYGGEPYRNRSKCRLGADSKKSSSDGAQLSRGNGHFGWTCSRLPSLVKGCARGVGPHVDMTAQRLDGSDCGAAAMRPMATITLATPSAQKCVGYSVNHVLSDIGTKVCRYNWHSAGSLGWPVPMLKYKYIFSNKIYGSNFIKQHSESETVMV